ncbi:MAG TPA: serine hydrolase [Pirellulales bacterium]|nr:serine hydrolase [Pirellulales bacterium]
MTCCACCVLGLLGLPAAGVRAADEASPLADRLLPLIKAHRGRVGAAVKNLKTGESFAYQADEPMPTASLIKFPVLVELYRQVDAGQVDLGKMLVLNESDKAPGSGILTTQFSAGASFPLRDAARLMIAYSDNTATNLVLDQIGLSATTETMEQLGYPNTRLHHKVYLGDKTSIDRERSEKYGLGSTTAAEMLRLYEALARGELASPESTKAMRRHLRACEERNKFPRFLPYGTVLAFKGGSVDQARTAAGIIESPAGPLALCVLTAENEDRSWTPDNAGDRLCAEIAREVFAYFNPGPGESAAPRP